MAIRGNGWMRIYAPDGEYLGATPMRDGKQCDGSYGLIEYLNDGGPEEEELNQRMADRLEADLLRHLRENPSRMARSMGFSAIYIEDDEPQDAEKPRYFIDFLEQDENNVIVGWYPSSEGPFDTIEDATTFAENEVGVSFRIVPKF
jgi:hypothetical protein